MVFNVAVKVDGKRVLLKVERVYMSDQLERYRVSARNKSLVIQSNRPLLRARGLMRRKPNWKLIEGQLHNSYLLQSIIDAVSEHVKMSEKDGL